MLSDPKLDSLFAVYKTSGTKTRQTSNLLSFTFELRNTNVDSAEKWIRVAYENAIELKNEILQAEAAIQFAFCEEFKSNYRSALKYYLLAANLFTKNKHKSGLAKCYTGMGVIYWYQGMYSQAQDYFNKNIKISTELNDDEGLAASYGNLAIIFDELSEPDSSLRYYKKALAIYLRSNNELQLSSCYDNMSLIYLQKRDFKNALEVHAKGFEIRKRTADTLGIMASMENLGSIYIKQNKPDKAIEVSNEVLKIAGRLNAKEDVKFALINLRDAYELKNDIKSAYAIQSQLMRLKDSLRNQDNMNQIAELEARFKNKEQEAELGEIKLQQKLNEQINESNNKRKDFWIVILVISGISFLLILTLIFKRFKEKQKVAEELEMKNTAIHKQKLIIDKAYAELAESNKDITDSIRYAQRIQVAIFPSDEKMMKLLPQSFVFFQPKDIVSGDFYWVENVGDTVYFALVDCTGHGVPGAFMSIVGENLLNKALFESKLKSPAEILNQVNIDLNLTLKQSDDYNVIRDGMEITLCTWNKKTNEFVFAGANHILYQISDKKLITHKGDKHPIGASYSDVLRKFNDVTISVKNGDYFYLTSDGFPDQFGGPKGKKFKYRQLEEKLVLFNVHEMSKQKELLSNCFNDWKGSLEQLDDVLVLGVKISKPVSFY